MPAAARTTRKQLRAVVPLAREPAESDSDSDLPSRSAPIRIPKPEWQRTLEALGHQIEQVRVASVNECYDRNDARTLYARTDTDADRVAAPSPLPVRSSLRAAPSPSRSSSRSPSGSSSGSSHGVCVAPRRSGPSTAETVPSSSSSSSPASEAYYSAVFSLESDSSRSSQRDLITAYSLSDSASPSSSFPSSSVPTDVASEPEEDRSEAWVHLGIRLGTLAPAHGGAVRLAVSLVVAS